MVVCAYYQAAQGTASSLQIQGLFKAAFPRSLVSLRVALNGYYTKIVASQPSLNHVWSHIGSFSELLSLTLVDDNGSEHMVDGLSELGSLTSLTSLWLQQGRAATQNGNPAHGGSLRTDIGNFDEAVHPTTTPLFMFGQTILTAQI